MNLKFILNIFGRVLMLLGAFMLLPVVCAIIYKEPEHWSLISASFLTLAAGGLMYVLTMSDLKKELNLRDSYFTVTFVWVILSLFGTLPYLLTETITDFADALFETVSGFTSTGSSVISDVESLPHSILFWRSLSQWLGGIGIIVLVVAIMPLLRIGGYNLFKSEASGMSKEKLTPKTASTAKRLWGVYVTLTAVLAILLAAGDMGVFDAINHAFTTMATGGFSTKNDSLASFSAYTQYVVMFFMFLAGMNLYLHYHFYKGRFRKVFENIELRSYFWLVVVVTVLIVVLVLDNNPFARVGLLVRNAFFQVISMVTTTGFATYDYQVWPSEAWMLMFMLMFSGACLGSTGGGIKLIRHVVAYKHIVIFFRKMLHPNSVSVMKLRGEAIDEEKVGSIISFLLLYMITFCVGSVLLVFLGADFLTSIGAVASSLGGVGMGIGNVGAFNSYAEFSDAAKLLLSLLMIIGRLELSTVLILLTSQFWRDR